MKVTLPYGIEKLTLNLPESAKVEVLDTESRRQALSKEEIDSILENPIGQPSLENSIDKGDHHSL